MKNLKICLVTLLLFLTACAASSTESALDGARFALDDCSPTATTACQNAITEADKVLAGDANNADAALIKSAAYAGMGHVDMLSLISNLADTEDTADVDQDTQKFKFIRDSLAEDTDLTNLRLAITTLTGITAPVETHPSYRDFYFQLGILQALEAFIRPTKIAQPTATTTVDSTTVDDITDDDADIVLNDFINADNNLDTGGIGDSGDVGWEIVEMTRKNYCAAKNVNTANVGFSTEELRALMLCQLHAAPDDLRGVDGDFPGTAIATCADFDYNQCADTDTAE